MTYSIGQTPPSSETPGVEGVQPPTESTGVTEEVGFGYDSENSMSHQEASDGEGVVLDSSVELDNPQTNSMNSRDFLQKAFDARLEGFRAIVAEFNARFNNSEIDLSDTQTILMVIKGIVSDTRALLNANTIDQNSSNRALFQARRQNAAREQQQLQADIKQQQVSIDAKTQQKGDKEYDLSQKNAGKLLKENELVSAQLAGNDDLITTLQNELAQINAEIDLLEGNVASLTQQLTELESQKAINQSSLLVIQKLLIFATESVPVVRQVLGKLQERYDSEALQTGEEAFQKTKRENREGDIQRTQEATRQDTLKQDMKKQFKEVIEREQVAENDKASENILPEGIILSQRQLDGLSALIPVPITPEIVKAASVPPTAEQVAELGEALAIVLQAEPPEQASRAESSRAESEDQNAYSDSYLSSSTQALSPEESNPQSEQLPVREAINSSEKQPVNQTHLGDSRSLEGADNPQAFGLLLLEQNMAQLRENALHIEGVFSAENVESLKVAKLMAEQQKIDDMVAEALEEAERADAVIRRSPV